MKVAITSRGDNLESAVDQRFQAASYILVYDTANDNWRSYSLCSLNSEDRQQLVQEIFQNEAEVILTGYIDHGSFRRLVNYGIKIYAAPGTSVSEAVKLYLLGSLEPMAAPNALDVKVLNKGLAHKIKGE